MKPNRVRVILLVSALLAFAGAAVAIVLVLRSRADAPDHEAASTARAAAPTGDDAPPRRRRTPRGPTAKRPLACEGRACEPRCDAGELYACHRIAQGGMSFYSDAGADPRLLALFEKACAGSFGASCWTLGDMVSRGLGVPKDEARGKELHQRAREASVAACDDGDAFECTVAAELIKRGTGGEKDEERAAQLFAKAQDLDGELCDGGRADACTQAAKGYRGQATPAPEVAAKLYAKACELGEDAACGMREYAENVAAHPKVTAGELNRDFRLTEMPALSTKVGAVLLGPSGDETIEIVGVELTEPGERGKAKSVTKTRAGEPLLVRMYLRVIRPLEKDWDVGLHVDGRSRRNNGDHEPMGGLYPTSKWKAGEILVDTHEMRLEPPSGSYTVYVALFLGAQRLKVKGGAAGGDDRVKVGRIDLQ